MQLEDILKYASSLGRLKGTITGILKYNKDEISPSVRKTLESALRFVEEEFKDEKKDI